MILTVTMNASVDITYVMDHLDTDGVNRVTHVAKTAGGKGLNVSRVLHQAGQELMAGGLIGGTTGAYIRRALEKQGIPCRFLETRTESRNNISIIHGSHNMEILEQGNPVAEEDLKAFSALYEELLKEADTIAISGSLPPGIPEDYYGLMAEAGKRLGRKVLLDTSGKALKAALASPVKPFLIKPNEKEAEELTGRTVCPEDTAGLKEMLLSPVFEDIPWVMISLGAGGAITKCHDRILLARVPAVRAVNPIGSGDSVIAGLAMGLSRKEDPETVIRRAMTFGVLNALDETPGHLKMDLYEDIYRQIDIKEESR